MNEKMEDIVHGGVGALIGLFVGVALSMGFNSSHPIYLHVVAMGMLIGGILGVIIFKNEDDENDNRTNSMQ